VRTRGRSVGTFCPIIGISTDERPRDAEIECPNLVEDSLDFVDKSAQR